MWSPKRASSAAKGANAATPTFQSCRISPLQRRRHTEFSSSRASGHSPPLLPSDIRSEPKAERCCEREWNVSEEWRCLPQVPPMRVLGVTKTVVMGGSSTTNSPADVAFRIGDCLSRQLNLDVAYDHGRVVALATSSDGVKFFVRLFRHGSERGTIVEVKKKRGSTQRFLWMAGSVLRAARGETTAPKPDAPPRLSPIGGSPLLGPTARPTSLPRQLPRPQLSAPPMAATQDPEYTTEAALETLDDLLRQNRTEAREQGMESLALLTDEESSGKERALGIARVLLLGMEGKNDGGERERYSSVRQKIVDLVVNRHEEDEMNGYERHHMTAMRRLAMTALGNSVAILSHSSPAVLADRVDGLGGLLLSVLMEDVERAEHSLQNATSVSNQVLRR